MYTIVLDVYRALTDARNIAFIYPMILWDIYIRMQKRHSASLVCKKLPRYTETRL